MSWTPKVNVQRRRAPSPPIPCRFFSGSVNDLASTDSAGKLVVWRLAFKGAEEVQVQTLLCLALQSPGPPPLHVCRMFRSCKSSEGALPADYGCVGTNGLVIAHSDKYWADHVCHAELK